MKWISVKDRFPEDKDGYCKDDYVLVFSAYGEGGPSGLVGLAQFWEGKWDIVGNNGTHSCTGVYELTSEMVTHWARVEGPSNE